MADLTSKMEAKLCYPEEVTITTQLKTKNN